MILVILCMVFLDVSLRQYPTDDNNLTVRMVQEDSSTYTVGSVLYMVDKMDDPSSLVWQSLSDEKKLYRVAIINEKRSLLDITTFKEVSSSSPLKLVPRRIESQIYHIAPLSK